MNVIMDEKLDKLTGAYVFGYYKIKIDIEYLNFVYSAL
jgi:hypothetical protein